MNRRDSVIKKIESRCEIKHTGFMINGKASPCHLWTGPDSGTGRGGGYGRMSLDGQTVAVHLVAYTHYFGYIPSKKKVDHQCNQRRCCNPQHLDLVTHLENCRRRDKRASISKTEKSPTPTKQSGSEPAKTQSRPKLEVTVSCINPLATSAPTAGENSR